MVQLAAPRLEPGELGAHGVVRAAALVVRRQHPQRVVAALGVLLPLLQPPVLQQRRALRPHRIFR